MDSVRKNRILEVDSIETLSTIEEGLTLYEGYDYNINCTLMQLAHSLANLAIELDKDTDMGEQAGHMFLRLILDYYESLINTDTEEGEKLNESS